MEDRLILCRYLSKKKLILSRTAFRIISIILSPSLISMIIKSLIHHDCQTFGSRYPFDLDTIDSQHYIKLDKIYYFFLFPCPHPRFVLKKEKEKKKKKRIWTQTIHFVRWVEKYKETKTTHISTSHAHISTLCNWYQSIRVNPCVLHI